MRSGSLEVSETSGCILKLFPSFSFSDECLVGSLVSRISQNNIKLQNNCMLLFSVLLAKSGAIFLAFYKCFLIPSSTNFM